MSHAPTQSLHLIADIVGASGLSDLDLIEATLHEAAEAAKVTVLDVRLHHFGAGQGVTGVALLAESHISIHTWPESGMAAVDIFVCGKTSDAYAALAVMERRLNGATSFQRAISRLGSADDADRKPGLS